MCEVHIRRSCLNLANHSSKLLRSRFSQPNPELTHMASSPCSQLALSGIRFLPSTVGTGRLSNPLGIIPAFWQTELWSSQSVDHSLSPPLPSLSHPWYSLFQWGLFMINQGTEWPLKGSILLYQLTTLILFLLPYQTYRRSHCFTAE